MVEILFNLPAIIGHFLFNLIVWSLVFYMLYSIVKDTYDDWRD